MASKQRNMAFVDDELHSETPFTVHVESQIIDMNMDVEVSNYTCGDQGGMNASPEPTEDNNSTEVGYNPTDSEELCDTIPSVPASETELDMVDPEGVPGPSSSEQEPVCTASLEVDISDARNPTEIPEVTKIGKFFSFFGKLFGFTAQPETDPELLSVSEESDYESASEMDEVDMEQSCVPEPETELDLVDPEGVPVPRSSEQEPVFRETLYVDLIKPHTSINLKRSVSVSTLLKEPAEPSTEEVESSSGIDQDGINASPEIPQVDRPTEVPEMWKATADLPMIYGFSAQHQTDPEVAEMSVSEANDYESASLMDEVDVEQTSVSDAEAELDLVDPEGVPGPSSSKQEPVFREALYVDLIKPQTSFNVKRSVLVSKLIKEPAEPSTEDVKSSRGIDQDGMNGSPKIPQVDRPSGFPKVKLIRKISQTPLSDPTVETDEVDTEQTSVSDAEAELDLVDPEGVPVPSSSEQEPVFREALYVDLIKPHPSFNLKRSVLVSKLIKEPAEPSTEDVKSSRGIDQDGISASPKIPQVDRPTGFPKVKIIKKVGAFIRKRFGFSVHPKAEPAVAMDEVDTEQTSVSDPEAELDLVDPEGVPGPSSSEKEPVYRETLHVIDLIKPHTSFNLKRSVLVSKPLKEPAEPSTEDVKNSRGIDQDGLNGSSETTQVDRPSGFPKAKLFRKINAFIRKRFRFSIQPKSDPTIAMDEIDTEQTSVSDPEMELDLVDPEGVPGPSSSEQEPVPRERMDVNITDAMNPTESTKVRMISKVRAFSRKLHDISAKLKTEPNSPQPLSVPDATGSLNTSVIDEEAVDHSPETPEDHSPTGLTKEWMMNQLSEFYYKLTSPRNDLGQPGPSSLPPRNLLNEVFDFQKLAELLKIEATVNKCKLPLSPFTEVWRNVYIGDEETARNRRKLMELGVTHILNAAAPKMTWEGKPKKKGLKGKILTGPEYYEGMDIKYCGLPTTYDQMRIVKYFWPAGKFIAKALRKPDNVLFIHCKHGVSHAPTLFVAYLMMYYKLPLEEAIGYVTRARRIRPFSSFLLQLLLLEPTKKTRKRRVIRKQKGIVIYN
ncbi:uncharacterized protein isoform X5 [Danio rerio]|uniref:Uncharacterized protein isoform X5 n=1 Tax=Danio rerio TaxID=7955 RepID=A0AB32T690_DANRE